MSFEKFAELAMNYGAIPICFLFLMFQLVRQNRELQKQNNMVLVQMVEMVKDLVIEPRKKGEKSNEIERP